MGRINRIMGVTVEDPDYCDCLQVIAYSRCYFNNLKCI